jgi:hypothetical protein
LNLVLRLFGQRHLIKLGLAFDSPGREQGP